MVTMMVQSPSKLSKMRHNYHGTTVSNKLTTAEKEAVLSLMHVYADIFSGYRTELTNDALYSVPIRLMVPAKKKLEEME